MVLLAGLYLDFIQVIVVMRNRLIFSNGPIYLRKNRLLLIEFISSRATLSSLLPLP